MSIAIFYSWQSDSDKKVNRNFIESALEKAIIDLRQDVEIQEALREDMVLDKDTKGVPGTPPIVDTIFQKISDCTIFVPDLTFVARTKLGRPIPNPNVLIEYGWALKVLGHLRMLPVMNTTFGDPASEEMPFDMRHLRNPITYNLPSDSSEETRKKTNEKLASDLSGELRLFIKDLAENLEPDMQTDYVPTPWTTNPSTFLRQGEKLPHQSGFHSQKASLQLQEVERLYLRLIPTVPSTLIRSSKVALDFIRSANLRPMSSGAIGYFQDRNKHGAYACWESEGIIENLTQLFKSGEIWGIDCWTIAKETCKQHGKADVGYFSCVAVEEVFVHTLQNYLHFAENILQLKLPLRIDAGATDVEGYQMAAPPGMRITGQGEFGGYVHEQHLVRKEVIDDYNVPPKQILRPFFDYIWEECGLERPDKESLG